MRKPVRAIVMPLLVVAMTVFAWAPATAQDDSISGIVPMQEAGSFDVYLCESDLDFGTHIVTSSSPDIREERSVSICYVDDIALGREGHTVRLRATDFTTEGESAAVIPAQNVQIVRTWSPVRVITEGCDSAAFVDTTGLIHATGGLTVSDVPVEPDQYMWPADSTLDVAREVGRVEEGTGTAACTHDGAHVTAQIDLELNVPSGQASGLYQGTLELYVAPVDAP